LVDHKDTPERCRGLAMLHFDMEIAMDKYSKICEKMIRYSNSGMEDRKSE